MTLYEPNINIAQKRVKLLIPCSSNAIKSTKPNDAQKSDCDVSNKLQLNSKFLKYLNFFNFVIFTLQNVSKFHKLFRYYQNQAYLDLVNDNIFSFPNPHSTRAID